MRGLEQEINLFVAHFDILGMSSLLRRSNSEAWGLLCHLADAVDTEELPLSADQRANLIERFFSDTVIIKTAGDDDDSVRSIIARSFELFRCAFRRGIPLRGGIAHGSWIEAEASDKHDLFTGDALLRAYEIGESQQMISVALCDVTRERFLRNPFGFPSGSPVIKDYPIPVKGGHQNRGVLNWPAFCHHELQNYQLQCCTAQELANHFSGFGSYETLGPSERRKYENTALFIRGNS